MPRRAFHLEAMKPTAIGGEAGQKINNTTVYEKK